MSVEALLSHPNILSREQARRLSSHAWPASHFTYVIWDMTPTKDWLPQKHSSRQFIESDRYRPLYVGKATNWSGAVRHLTKDGVGCSEDKVSDKNVINEGLIGYCLNKVAKGWLGMTFYCSDNGQKAQALEQKLVSMLEWRGDVYARKFIGGSHRKTAYLAGGRDWQDVLLKLKLRYADVVTDPTPLGMGILLNQTHPKHDGRGLM
ncbi:MAG: hypothetical protein K5831_06315 [Brevundimonas sp.]|uniref:hypothetical protein n=1 Tax=Brevundimonas sp. TaxID=1871086 RepID=UPI00258D7850|nr:hypothetical protein [Brevundimonas sp.]MCV0414479.1 hypothetical protein [Brevundimonas sp.]